MTGRTRRGLMGGATAVVLAAARPFRAMAQTAASVAAFVKGPPMPDQPLVRVSEHVWNVQSPDGFPTPQNQGMMCNVTFVIGTRGVMVVDSGASVQIGEMAIRRLRTITDRPVVGIVNTHYHGDHWLGNDAFVAAYGDDLPRHAHPETREAILGIEGSGWQSAMERWTAGATLGTRIVPPNADTGHGDRFSLGDVTLRLHHYGKAHTPCDLCVEVVEDRVMCVGDVMMDRRIANIEDGSYLGTFKAIDALVANSDTRIWLPAHGVAGPGVLDWQRSLFEGLYDASLAAVKDGASIEEARRRALADPRVASKAPETAGWQSNFGKYLSLAYLEAEQEAF